MYAGLIATTPSQVWIGMCGPWRTGSTVAESRRVARPDLPLRPAPTYLRPMLATLAHEVPMGDDWAYEMKWDGVRAFMVVQDQQVRLTSRNDRDITGGYPELVLPGTEFEGPSLLLDGEIVAMNANGRPDFQLLQRRMHVRDPMALRVLEREVPVVYMIFDVLWVNGRLLVDLPYSERRRELAALALGSARWQAPPASTGDGHAALATSRELSLEGIVAKQIDSRYESGRRSSAWRKIKHNMRQEFVIGGWTTGSGRRSGHFGSLLLGYYDGPAFRYAGNVGTGFSDDELDRLVNLLEPINTEPTRSTTSVSQEPRTLFDPEYIAEVRFAAWTAGGRIRQPAYLGLRDDKSPADVVKEG